MKQDMNVDPVLDSWFTEGPTNLPDRTVAAIVEGLDDVHQRKPDGLPGRLSMPRFVPALIGAALVVVIGVAALGLYVNTPGIGVNPSPTPSAIPSAPTSGGMWPQTTLEEAEQAQLAATAGDPDYTWQLAPQLVEYDELAIRGHEVELVDRFLGEVLGWEAYTVLDIGIGTFGSDGTYNALADQRYLRCDPGRTNPLYSDESCAPSLDDFYYEQVSVDVAQLDHKSHGGIWVVTQWELAEPFAQADPVAIGAQGTEFLEEFLAARIAGSGAEGLVQVWDDVAFPLLYATTSGAPYDRYEIELMDAPGWPDASMDFSARLFADGDATVVEQQIGWSQSEGLSMDYGTTTENGRAVDLVHTSSDGEVTVKTPSTWDVYWPRDDGSAQVPDVWFGMLWPDLPDRDGDAYTIGLVDPVAYDAWCGADGVTSLLSEPTDAVAIAQALIADPIYETTAPVAAIVGGVQAVSIDVTLAPGGTRPPCVNANIQISRWVYALATGPDLRLRLYLVDLPGSMSVQTLAITVLAPAADFEDFIEETAPIIESIEFHLP